MAAPMENADYLKGKENAAGNAKKTRKETYEATVKQLDMIANIFSNCPVLARFYMLKKKAMEEEKDVYQIKRYRYSHCPYCYTPRLPGTHIMRLVPKMKLTAKVRRLLNKHTENPGTLGKFQQKLVNDYVTGGNRLEMKCLSCQKTVKLPGMSRQKRIQQKEKSAITEHADTVQVPKSRKEKIREKKKRLKRRKRDQKEDTDINAGLTVNKSSPTGIIDGDSEEQATSLKEMTGSQNLTEEKTLSAMSNEKAKNTSPQDRKTSTNQRTSDKINTTALFNNSQRTKTKPVTDIMATHKVGKLKPTAAASILPSKKTKNVKNLHKQLGDILKQEENKTGGGSLADFLSSL